MNNLQRSLIPASTSKNVNEIYTVLCKATKVHLFTCNTVSNCAIDIDVFHFLSANRQQNSTAHLFLEDHSLTTIFTRVLWDIHTLDAMIITHIHDHFLILLIWLEEGFYCLEEEVHLFLLTYMDMMKRCVLTLAFSFVSVQTESQVRNPLSSEFSNHGNKCFGTGRNTRNEIELSM